MQPVPADSQSPGSGGSHLLYLAGVTLVVSGLRAFDALARAWKPSPMQRAEIRVLISVNSKQLVGVEDP